MNRLAIAMRVVGAACLLALLLAGCGSSKTADPVVGGESAASVPAVIAAMDRQPRLVATLTGGDGTVRRIVVDTKIGYLAMFAPSGRLIVMDKHGIEYRAEKGCYGRFRVGQGSASENTWLDSLREATESRYTITRVRGSVIFRSRFDRVTVDARTNLIRSEMSPDFPHAGTPSSSETFVYPSSIAELNAPSPATTRIARAGTMTPANPCVAR